MSENLVPTTKPKVLPEDVYGALAAAWRDQIKTEPSRASLLVLLSQWAFETGNGGACLNYNIAGIKWTPGCGHDYAAYETREFLHGAWLTLEQKFRAYPDLAAGVADYLLELRHTFASAWPAVEAGDTNAFAASLKARGYYTAPEPQYAAGLAARYALLAKEIPDQAPATPEPIQVASIQDIGQPTPPGDLPPAVA